MAVSAPCPRTLEGFQRSLSALDPERSASTAYHFSVFLHALVPAPIDVSSPMKMEIHERDPLLTGSLIPPNPVLRHHVQPLNRMCAWYVQMPKPSGEWVVRGLGSDGNPTTGVRESNVRQ